MLDKIIAVLPFKL